MVPADKPARCPAIRGRRTSQTSVCTDSLSPGSLHRAASVDEPAPARRADAPSDTTGCGRRSHARNPSSARQNPTQQPPQRRSSSRNGLTVTPSSRASHRPSIQATTPARTRSTTSACPPSRTRACFAIAEQTSVEAGPARLLLVRSGRETERRRERRKQAIVRAGHRVAAASRAGRKRQWLAASGDVLLRQRNRRFRRLQSIG
jgi:hypothetical protein